MAEEAAVRDREESAATNGDDGPSEEEQFRQDQEAAAAQQAGLATPAVPERRPQAFQGPEGIAQSEVAQKLEEQGVNQGGQDDSAMGKEAYDRAEENADRTSKTERHEALKVADAVRVTDEHPTEAHRGRVGTIVRIITFASDKDAVKRLQGAEESRFANPGEVEVRLIGGDRTNEALITDAKYLERTDRKGIRTHGS